MEILPTILIASDVRSYIHINNTQSQSLTEVLQLNSKVSRHV